MEDNFFDAKLLNRRTCLTIWILTYGILSNYNLSMKYAECVNGIWKNPYIFLNLLGNLFNEL